MKVSLFGVANDLLLTLVFEVKDPLDRKHR
jgi:hypothetical protein